METLAQIIPNALTATSARPTKGLPVNIADWAGWLRLETHRDPELEALVGVCAAFATAFKRCEAPRWLSILGVTGTGKTHCARRLWEHLRGRSDWSHSVYLPQVVYWPQFVSELRGGQAFDQFRDLWRWPALLIDDIGAERDTTGFASEQLNTLLGCRVGKWTLMTSNLMLEQLGSVESRIADRMIREPNLFIEVNTKSHSLRRHETRINA